MPASSRRDLVQRVAAQALPGPTHGAAIAVLGVGGIGKSTLVASVSSALESTGVRVHRSKAGARTERDPFASVRDLFDGAPIDPVAAALETVDAWCGQGPVLLWVDDAQHLDASSTIVLTRLARATRDLPLTLLISARPHMRSPELAKMLELCSDRIDLHPLDDGELAAMVEQRFGRRPGPRLRSELAIAGGNPLAIELVLGLLQQRDLLLPDGNHLELDVTTSAAPEPVAMAVRSYVAQLPDETQQVLRVLAVLGTPATLDDVAAVSDRAVVSLADTLRYAVDAGVIQWEDDGVVFRHDLFPEVLVQQLPQAVRTALHRRAVKILQARDAPPSAVAEHAWRGEDPHDVPLVRSVAASFETSAPGVAADLLAHVQPLIAPDECDEMIADRAESLLRAGRGRDAEDLISSYLPRATSREQLPRLYRLALTSMAHRANSAVAHAHIDNLLASRRLSPDSTLQLVALRCWLLVLDGNLAVAADVALQLDELERHVQEAGSIADYHVLPVRSVLAWLHGKPLDALRMEQGETDLRTADPARKADFRIPVLPPSYLLYARGPAVAERANAQARAYSNQMATTFVEPYHDFVLGEIQFLAGSWDDADAVLNAGLELGEETGSRALAEPWGISALIDAHRGRIVQAHSKLEVITRRRYLPQMGRDFAALAFVQLAEAEAVSSVDPSTRAADWTAAFATAKASVQRLWAEAVARGGELWMAEIAGYVVRIADEPVQRNVIDVLGDLQLRQMPVLAPIQDQVLAMHDGDHAAVAAAAQAFADAAHPLAAGFAWEECGLLAARHSAPGMARQALRNAMAIYQELDAAIDLLRARTRAHRLGIRGIQPRSTAKAATGWAALTPTETKVAALVREGMTNPDIARRLVLSPRTVQTHVSHILQKTQLRSRVEIAARFA